MAGLKRLPPPPKICRVAAPSLGCRFSPIWTKLSCKICMSALTGSRIRLVDTVGLKPLPSTSRARLVASTEEALDMLSVLSSEGELLVAADCSLLGAYTCRAPGPVLDRAAGQAIRLASSVWQSTSCHETSAVRLCRGAAGPSKAVRCAVLLCLFCAATLLLPAKRPAPPLPTCTLVRRNIRRRRCLRA